MAIEFINPESVYTPPIYSQCIRVGNIIYLSGQVGRDKDNQIVSMDVAEQADRAYQAIQQLLEAAGASMRNVVKLVVYLTKQEDLGRVGPLRDKYFGDHRPCNTTVVVQALARPEYLIEIDATAVV